MQSVQRYILFAYLGVALLLWATLSRLLNAVAYYLSISDVALVGSRLQVSTLLALVLSGGALAYSWKNPAVRSYTSEVVLELSKVTWPGRKETQRSTVVVIVASLVLSALVGLVDFLWGQLTGLIYT